MGRGSGYTFFPKKMSTGGQEAHEKMLSIINHQGNANQYHNEKLPHTCQNGYYHKDKKQQVLTTMWMKGNPPAQWLGMKIGATTMKKSMEFPQNTEKQNYHMI